MVRFIGHRDFRISIKLLFMGMKSKVYKKTDKREELIACIFDAIHIKEKQNELRRITSQF